MAGTLPAPCLTFGHDRDDLLFRKPALLYGRLCGGVLLNLDEISGAGHCY